MSKRKLRLPKGARQAIEDAKDAYLSDPYHDTSEHTPDALDYIEKASMDRKLRDAAEWRGDYDG